MSNKPLITYYAIKPSETQKGRIELHFKLKKKRKIKSVVFAYFLGA